MTQASRFMVETHRDRMTTDLLFTLQLLDCFPDLRLTADLSHYLVGREFAWPVDDTNHALIHRILDSAWGILGRIASREQVQISLGFPQHQGWVGLFEQWWEYGIRSWKKRAGRAYCGRALRRIIVTQVACCALVNAHRQVGR